jgi:hypothetical protein
MTDALANVMPRIAQLLLVALSPGATEGERVNAMRAVQQQLERANSDSHELVERIKTPPLSENEMQKIFDAGREQGRAEEVEKRRRAMVAVNSPLVSGGVGDGINGYSWWEIVGHCATNAHRLSSQYEREFAESIAGQFQRGERDAPSPKQEPVLRRIFIYRFGGKI